MDEKKQQRKEKFQAVWTKTKTVWSYIRRTCAIIGKVLYHMRKLFLATPVVIAAIRLYAYAQENFPDTVGIFVQSDGTFMYSLDKNVASMGCMAVTACCLLLMFLSRRTIYPWVISIFSLILPAFLVLTNTFPA